MTRICLSIKGNYMIKEEFSLLKMSKSSGSGFASFKRAVSGGNKVGNDEKSSGEFQNTFFYISII